MWNLKNKIKKQNRNRLIDTENILSVARGKEVRRMGEKGEGIKKYKLEVSKWSWGCQVQHREYSQLYSSDYRMVSDGY